MSIRTWLGVAAGSVALAGGPPAVASPTLPPVQATLVPTRPPPPVREVVLDVRGRGSEWERTGGYWHWSEGRWVWTGARWQRRPELSAHWIPPAYERQDGAWKYVPGRWSSQRISEPRRDRQKHAMFLESRPRAAR